VIFRNGVIRTMVPGEPQVEALAVGGSKILAAGTDRVVSALRDRDTRVVDLQGRTVFPGFIDPHHHYVLASVLEHLLLNIGHAKSGHRGEALAQLTAQATATAEGDWIAAGFYDNLLQGGDLTMEELDRVSTRHPIFVLYVNGHVGAANSLAFQRAGIGEDVQTVPGGGHFGRVAGGKHNGLIYEQPALMRFLGVAVQKPSAADSASALTAYLQKAAAAGNTTLHEPGTIKPADVDSLARLSTTLDVRLSASFSTDMLEESRSFADLGTAGKARRIVGSRFSLCGMKFWADGSNQAKMAAQTQPYLSGGEKGELNYAAPEMAALCEAAAEARWSILVHSQGDAAVDAVLDAVERGYGPHPDLGINRIEHATMARLDQMDRMKSLGVQPSFLPDLLYLYGAEYREQLFGVPRAELMCPFGAAVKAGLPFSLHSDAPAMGLPINPLRHVQTAVTRRCATDSSVLGAELVVSVDDAMRAITVNAACHVGLDEVLGTLESGKEADLTILDCDPYSVPPEQISMIGVSETWVAGEQKFS
jgi:predicted amidohydrolase YtcJ